MPCSINNKSNYDISEIKPLVQDMYDFGQKRFGFKKAPTISFVSDRSNHHLLGKTGQYDPNKMEITVFTDNRHPKDMMRSIAHELIHHLQNLDNQFDNSGPTVAGYAQKDPHMRKMEADAYLRGNLYFRDWEDRYKSQHKDIFYERRIYKMSTKKWKNKEVNGLLTERWGFGMNLDALNEKKQSKAKDPDKSEFAKNQPPYDKATARDRAGSDGKHNQNEGELEELNIKNALVPERGIEGSEDMTMDDIDSLGTLEMAPAENLRALLRDVVNPGVDIEELAAKIRASLGMPPEDMGQAPEGMEAAPMDPMMEKKIRKAAKEALRRMAKNKSK